MAIIKATIVLILLSCLIGCDSSATLSNEKVIEEVHKCEAAGLKSVIWRNFEGGIARIECIPKN